MIYFAVTDVLLLFIFCAMIHHFQRMNCLLESGFVIAAE